METIETMTPIEKTVLLLAFYTSPWGSAKGAMWEFFVDDKMPLTEDSILSIIGRIVNGTDELVCDWTALNYFKDKAIEAMEGKK